MLFLRKIFFYLFLSLYIVLCPLIVFYAFGFILKPGSPEEVVKTGLVYFNSVPEGASVSDGDTVYPQKTPVVIRDLLPGLYPFKLTYEGYKEWDVTVKIMANEATPVDNILLMPEKWYQIQLLQQTFQDMMPILKHKTLLLKKSALLKDHSVYNIADNKLYQINMQNEDLDNMRVASYFIDQSSGEFVIETANNKNKKYFIYISFDGENMNVEDITPIVSFIPESMKIMGSGIKDNDLFYYKDNVLYKADITDKAIYPDYLTGIKGYGAGDGQLYFITMDNKLIKMNTDKTGKTILLEDPSVGLSVFNGDIFNDIRPISDDLILFINKNGRLACNHLPYIFVEEGVEGFKFHKESEKLLFWTDKEIGVIDFKAEKTTNTLFEKAPEDEILYKGSGKISQAFWVLNGAYIMFKEGESVSIARLDGYKLSHLEHIVNVEKNSSIYYSKDSGIMYYLENESGRLFYTNIVPKTSTVGEKIQIES